jgi:hypothetical protein
MGVLGVTDDAEGTGRRPADPEVGGEPGAPGGPDREPPVAGGRDPPATASKRTDTVASAAASTGRAAAAASASRSATAPRPSATVDSDGPTTGEFDRSSREGRWALAGAVEPAATSAPSTGVPSTRW